jgi:hypothetical protein
MIALLLLYVVIACASFSLASIIAATVLGNWTSLIDDARDAWRYRIARVASLFTKGE